MRDLGASRLGPGPTSLAVAAVVVAAALAGCAAEPAPDPLDIPVGSGRAALAGVVVDPAIRPVAGALVNVTGAGLQATTGPDGEFLLPVPVGDHLLEVSHASFAVLRQTVTVPADGARGVVLRFAFTASEAPYSFTTKFDGFIVCSLGVSVIFSEECGEGVGTPVGRFGKQDNNLIRHDFTAESSELKSIVIELAWTPTSEAGKELLVLFATGWACEPACDGNRIAVEQGPSPILLRADEEDLAEPLQDPATVFTTYVLARNDVSQVNAVLNQGFQEFVTHFYREPAPEGYSFVAGS